jgi:cytochrome oxidase Cu insertion factor (SCO1/SenC/PrrC family)
MIRKLMFVLLTSSLLLAACGPGKGGGTMGEEETATAEAMMGDHMMETPTAEMQDHMMASATPAMEDHMMDTATPEGQGMMESPSWYGVTFKDARTGNAFSIDGLKGKVILVETMAVWCTNCLQQQKQIDTFHQQLGMNDNFVSISLDIDPNEDAAQLKSYVDSKGFDWLYAVAPSDVSREISQLYGTQFLNPPSTPVLIIDSHGIAHPLPFGIKSADDLMKDVQPYLNGSM